MTELTHEELTRILDYDPETGVFRWKVQMGRCKIGDVAGSKGRTGNRIKISENSHSARRLAWFYVYKQWPERNLFVKELGQFNDSIKNIGMLPKKPETLTQEYLKECIRKGALSIKILGKQYYTNRLIWFYMTGEFPDESVFILTKNNILTDLRWDNLVIGSISDINQKKRVMSKTGFKGVSFNKQKKKYQAKIKHRGKQTTLGYFPTPEEAHEAYMKAAAEHFGEFHNDGYQHVSFED